MVWQRSWIRFDGRSDRHIMDVAFNVVVVVSC